MMFNCCTGDWHAALTILAVLPQQDTLFQRESGGEASSYLDMLAAAFTPFKHSKEISPASLSIPSPWRQRVASYCVP